MKTPIMVNKKKPNFISKSRSYISIYVYIIVILKGVVLKLKKYRNCQYYVYPV